MARTTKEVKNEPKKEINKKKTSNTKKSTAAATKKQTKTSTKSKVTKSKTTSAKKVASKKAETEKISKPAKKNSSTKAVAKPAKKATSTKAATKSSKNGANAKTSTKKNTAKSTAKAFNPKATSKSKKSPSKNVKKPNSKIDILEYYDLPYRYNQTIVKVLAQTPKTLFVYWDISDEDRNSYLKQYGENFFETTKPVLIIHNKTMNYTFEIEINDFANCWYFNINDEKCDYLVELGRRPKDFSNSNTPLPNNYLYITSSNEIESPNGHILFEKEQKTIYYRNVKTNEVYSKDVANLNFLTRLGRIYKIYDIYKKMYKNEEIFGVNNNPTSRFF